MALSPLAEQLLGALEQLPTNENPYSFVVSQLNASLLPTLPDSAAKQLYFLAAVFGLAGILILISHAIRIKKNAIWVFRWQPEYKLIRVHATLSWSIPAILVVALFEVLIVRTIQLANGNGKSDYGYWLLLVWGSAWVSGCIATWALASSFIVHLHTSGEARQPPKPIHSQLCNVLGIAAPVVYLAILLPLGIIAGQHYAASQRTATQIKRLLNAAASQWTPGTSFSMATLAPTLPLLGQLQDQVDELIKWWKAVFMFYAVSAIVLLAPIASISYLYLTSLRRTIKLTAEELGQSIGRNRDSQRQIKLTWISLVVIMSSFTILASIFFIVSIYAYVRPTSLRRDSTFQGLIFTPLWAFAMGGFPCAAILVFRAVETRSTGKKPSTEGEKSGSNCWSAVWSGSRSTGNTAVDARGREEMQGYNSEAISFGAMLRGFGGNQRRGRGEDELTRSVGAGSNVVVRVEVEVREDGGSSGEEMKSGQLEKEKEKNFDRI